MTADENSAAPDESNMSSTNEEPRPKAGLIAEILGFLFRIVRLDVILDIGVIFSVIYFIYKFITLRNYDSFESLGNSIIMAGALLVSKGVVLKNSLRGFLFEIIEQEKISPTLYLRETSLIRFHLRNMRRRQKSVAFKNVRRMYRKRLRMLHSPGGVRKYVGQKLLAEILVASSDYGEAGTLLVVIGTLCVLFNNFPH